MMLCGITESFNVVDITKTLKLNKNNKMGADINNRDSGYVSPFSHLHMVASPVVCDQRH